MYTAILIALLLAVMVITITSIVAQRPATRTVPIRTSDRRYRK